jgi:transcriptional antiterminator NusG
MDYFVAQVSTGNELKIKRILELQNNEWINQIFIPRKRISIRKLGKKRDKIQTIFPGYLFLGIDSSKPDVVKELIRNSEIIRILPENAKPKALEGNDLTLIKHFLSFGEVLEKSLVQFNKNDRIVIKEGPLLGLEGNIIKIDKRKQRARVKLDMYSESFQVDFGFEYLDKSN